MKNRILIYPFSEEVMPILRHTSLVEDFEIVSVVAPSGFGFSEKEIWEIDGGDEKINCNFKISDDFSKELVKCDSVWFLPFNKPRKPMKELIIAKVIESIENRKNIYWALDEEYIDIYNYREKAEMLGVSINIVKNTVNSISYENKILKEIDVPIILIAGECEETNKFEIQMALLEKIKEMGYSVSMIGSRNYCELLGFNSFPNFMSQERLEEEKIIMFNNYVHNIALKEESDLIIIGVPGGFKPINKFLNNGFGTNLFEISQAINPDVTICSFLCQDINEEFIEENKNIFKYRFNCSLDYINLSNNIFNWTGSFLLDNFKILNCDCNLYRKVNLNLGEKKEIINILTADEGVHLAADIIDKLSN